MHKEIIEGDFFRKRILYGVEKISSAVKTTFGPKGRSVIIQRKYGIPLITKDGVSVAKEIFLEDQIENLGATIIKEAAIKTNDTAGDGTTTATILCEALIKSGIKKMDEGLSPYLIKSQMEERVKEIINSLKALSKEASSEDLIKIATISSNNNKEIGEIVAKALSLAGENGVVSIDNGNKPGLEVSTIDGIKVESGYYNPYMVTNEAKMKAEYQSSRVLITNKFIESVDQIRTALNYIADRGETSLVIVADGFSENFISALVTAKLRGQLNILAIKAPGYVERKKDLLEDLAILLGANISMNDILDSDLGYAEKIIATKDNTIFIGGNVDEKKYKERVKNISNLIDNEENIQQKEYLKKRLASFTSGLVSIKVGSLNELEARELKDRIEDALNATKSAKEEGILTGGGLSLIKASRVLDGDYKAKNDGASIVDEAILEPLIQLITNSASVNKDIEAYIQKILSGIVHSDYELGYNALNNSLESLEDGGVLDSMKVVRTSLENACAAASILLTADVAVIINEKEISS